MHLPKLKPRVLFYRDYTKFSNETFTNSFKVELHTQSISPDENGFLNFCKIWTETLNKHALRKRKTVRGNQSPFINWEISKAIRKRTELRNKFFRHCDSRQAFVEQPNYFDSLLRKSKRNYHSNVNVKGIAVSKKFWKTLKPLLSDKTKSTVFITLKDNNKIVESQNEVANIFNDYFSKIVSSLEIPESNNINPQSERMSCAILKSITKYRKHPSITAI